MPKLYKIQAYLVDYNDDFKTIDTIKRYIDWNTRYGYIDHLHITEADLGEWGDDHPLNVVDCPEAEYDKYFKENNK